MITAASLKFLTFNYDVVRDGGAISNIVLPGNVVSGNSLVVIIYFRVIDTFVSAGGNLGIGTIGFPGLYISNAMAVMTAGNYFFGSTQIFPTDTTLTIDIDTAPATAGKFVCSIWYQQTPDF